MKAIITVLIFPMQKRNHKAAVNLLPQGHTTNIVVEKKTAAAILVSFVLSYQGSLLPNNSTFAHEIIWNGILSSEGKTWWLINHRDQSRKIFVRLDPSPCKCMMLEVKGDGWWNDKCHCLSNVVKPRSKEMLWLVERLMAHDLPWKFFSERYWNCLIKRAILAPTSASTCTDIKGEVPCKPMRDAAQLVAPGLAFEFLQHRVRQLCELQQHPEPIQYLLMQAVHPSCHERMETESLQFPLTEEISLRWTWAFWASRPSVNSKRQGSVQEEHDGERGKQFIKCPKRSSYCRTLSFFLLSLVFNTFSVWMHYSWPSVSTCPWDDMERKKTCEKKKCEMPVSPFPSLSLQYESLREAPYFFCAITSVWGWTTKDWRGLRLSQG